MTPIEMKAGYTDAALAVPPRSGWLPGLKFWRSQRGKRNLTWLLMALPAVIWVFVFKYLTLFGVWIAFTDFKVRRGLFGSEFVGLANFEFLFSTDTALRATRNTILLNLMFITVGVIFALFVAWLLYEVYSSYMTRFYQTLLLLPRFISWVVVSYFVYSFLATENGLINGILRGMGLEPISWYSTPGYWPGILLAVSLWAGVGMSSLIYLSGMLAIDTQLYEAARIDGANKWQLFHYITFPMILPLVVINLLLSLAYIMNADFGLFFQVTRDTSMLYPTTDVLDTYIYRSLIVTRDVSMAAAAQFYQSVIGFVLVIFFNWVVRRIERADEPLALF
ncbi:MAG: ABC transporter permease subunit [Chloroflexota bacterium]|nr:ABC transporter permease subunit [Chloroflexota bacterium]